MKKISNIINEAFSEAQLVKDYEDVDGMNLKEKKELAAKYECDAKLKDIRKAIAIAMKDVRKKKSSFDKNDLMWFWRMEPSERTIKDTLKEEPMEFIKFFADEHKKTGEKYGASMTGKRGWRLYDAAVAVMNDINTPQKDKDLAKRLRDLLEEKMADFKVEFMKRVEEAAKKKWKNLPNEIEKAKEAWKAEEERVSKYLKDNNIKGYHAWSYKKTEERLERKYRNLKYLLDKFSNETEFVEDVKKHAEKQYEGNLDALAERINEKKLDLDKLEISNIKDDPKYFSMMVTDGNRKLYCRSILAAQWSEKMVPHFRFIMTDRK